MTKVPKTGATGRLFHNESAAKGIEYWPQAVLETAAAAETSVVCAFVSAAMQLPAPVETQTHDAMTIGNFKMPEVIPLRFALRMINSSLQRHSSRSRPEAVGQPPSESGPLALVVVGGKMRENEQGREQQRSLGVLFEYVAAAQPGGCQQRVDDIKGVCNAS